MARPKRATTQKKVNYSTQQASDEEEEEKVEGSDSGDQQLSTAKDGSVEPEEYEEEDQEDAEEFVPKKKARVADTKGKGKTTAKGKGKGRAGKLQSMVDLPVDVWFMIAEHLDPPSLLSMGRANKMMRSHFASKANSQGLWNIVKRSIHLPDLEGTDFNDLALTSLIYDRDCHVCGKGRAVLVDYALRKRWCKNCRSNNLVQQKRLRSQVNNLTEYTAACSLSTTQGNTNYNSSGRRYHFLAEAIAINNEILEYKQAIEDAEGKKEKKEAKQALADYVDQRKAIVAAAFSDGTKLKNWESSSAHDRKAADTAARRARRNAIEDKLLELGYERKDMNDLWSVQTLVDKPTALTASNWTKISSQIVAVVEKNKLNRLMREARTRAESRRQAIKPYYEALKEASADPKLFPSFELFASMPSVQVLWKEEDSSIDEDSWHAALESIQDELPKVYRWIKLEFARNLLKAHENAGHPLPDEIRLSIHPRKARSTVNVVPTYGTQRDHDTALDIDDTSTISPDDLDALLSRFTATFNDYHSKTFTWKEFYGKSPYALVHGLNACVSQNWLKTQLEVLKQTELEDNSETSQKLQQLGPKFSCDKCHDNLYERPQYWAFTGQSASTAVKPQKTTGLTWKEMVQHAFEYHSHKYTGYYPSTLRILYEDRKPGSIVENEPAAAEGALAGVKEEDAEGGDALVLDADDDGDVKPQIELDAVGTA